jgi:MarR family transcriptional regulator, organic hydroperoxide resistance regulator
MPKASLLAPMAREIDQQLSAIRQALRRPVEAEMARGRLTGPQLSAMHALVHSGGLSLKELSRQMGLAHSTVSGIVDRLEKRGLVERRAHASDRRVTTIVASKLVRDYLREELPALALHPLLAALRRARPAERAAILEGLRTLRRALETPARR